LWKVSLEFQGHGYQAGVRELVDVEPRVQRMFFNAVIFVFVKSILKLNNALIQLRYFILTLDFIFCLINEIMQHKNPKLILRFRLKLAPEEVN